MALLLFKSLRINIAGQQNYCGSQDSLRVRAFPSFIRWVTIVAAGDQVGQAASAFPGAWLGLIP